MRCRTRSSMSRSCFIGKMLCRSVRDPYRVPMSSNDHAHHDHPQHHHHHHEHDDMDWGAMGEKIELEGEVLAGFVHDAARSIKDRLAGAPVCTIVDIGSGPGVGSCILAGAFPEATVTAVGRPLATSLAKVGPDTMPEAKVLPRISSPT